MTALLYPDLPKNALVVLIGASGAGKSVLAATWPPSQVVSLDSLSGCCRSDLEGCTSNGSLDRVVAAGCGHEGRASW
ncbi:hypothetical protein [Streptomyces olivochromogenes]|uniref:hypothetical protein n=1 Tax=Streptomyces olivochromogenes TaxID=1963 RepID=UPI0035B4D69B